MARRFNFSSRYGKRDSGGDDWVSRGTYQWLLTNNNLINAVDDVSGEHGRDLGHASHQFGTDIDTFHFYKFPGCTTGADNYNRLRKAVITAFGTLNADGTSNPIPSVAAITAKNQVLSFVTTTRTGLDNLSALATVERMFYMLGSKYSGLQKGWAQTLMKNGTVVLTANGVSRTLSLGLTSWSNEKVGFREDHHSHLHITLNRRAIGDK